MKIEFQKQQHFFLVFCSYFECSLFNVNIFALNCLSIQINQFTQ
jgi:hypothetical protein